MPLGALSSPRVECSNKKRHYLSVPIFKQTFVYCEWDLCSVNVRRVAERGVSGCDAPVQHYLDFLIQFGAGFFEFFGFLGEAFFDFFLFLGVIAHVLCDLHAAELRAAHIAEVGDLGGVLWQCFIVE